MRHGKPVLALALLALFAAVPLAWSQDDIMMLNSETLGRHERPLVRFTHEKHAGVIECVTCHHDFDTYYNNTGPQEVKCSECHLADPGFGDNPVPLRLAMHTKCKSCHQGMMKRGNKSGPVTCGRCHVIHAQAKEAPQASKPAAGEKKQ
jgi:hypothetical protein